MLKGGLAFLELHKVPEALSHIMSQYPPLSDPKFAGLKAARPELDQFELFQMLKHTGRIDREALLENFLQGQISEDQLAAWANETLLVQKMGPVPVNSVLIGQTNEALNWRLFV